MLSRIFPFQAMDISKLSGSQALLALFLALPWSPHPSSLQIIGFDGNFRSSICSTLVALHPASLGPGPMVPTRGNPLTYPALQEPFHSTWPQGFRSRTNFTFSSLNRVLGKEKKLSLSGDFLEREVFCLALRAGTGMGRESHRGGCLAWSWSRRLIRGSLWTGMVRGQNQGLSPGDAAIASPSSQKSFSQ